LDNGQTDNLCNGLTDRDVREHSAGEACSVAMVYRALGVKPQCGKCAPFVRQMLRQAAEPTLSCQAATAAT
jgi:bacterioferritin-associated ferredoxin